PLRVLRYHRQCPCVVGVPAVGGALLAALAESPEPRTVAHLGPFQSSAATISAAAGEGGPLGVRSRCEPMIGGTVCINVCTYGSVGALGGSPPGATRPRGGSEPQSGQVIPPVLQLANTHVQAQILVKRRLRKYTSRGQD